MRANLYIGVLIGVLIFVAIMWYQNRGKVEGFVDAGAGTGTAGAGAGGDSSTITPPSDDVQVFLATLNSANALKNYKYVEKKENIPSNGTLRLYYSAFSDETLAKETTYSSSTQHWNNHLAADERLMLLNTSSSTPFPESIKSTGLPVKSLKLNGLSVYKLTNSGDTLGSFSSSFYCKFNTITFTENIPIQVFDIPLVTPNLARLELKPIMNADGKTIDNGKVNICLYLGQKEYCLEETGKSIETLITGSNVLFTFVYDSINGKLFFYIGDSDNNSYNVSVGEPKPPLKYGYSGLKINETANLDINLQAIAFYNTALSFEAHKELLNYLKQQESGLASVLEAAKVMSQSQISAITDYVSKKTLTLEDLKKQLEECQATPKKEEEKKFKYGIPLPEGAEGVSETDLESCSILGVKKRGEKALPEVTRLATTGTGATTGTAATPATAATATPATQNRFFINVPFLKDIIPKSFTTTA